MVLLGHVVGTECFPFTWVPFAWGGLGVTVFFVISGYLITTLLLAEQRKTGAVSLRKFYLRRTLRIFPAFFVYLAAVLALQLIGFLELRDGDLLAAATYTMNFRAERSWWLGHTWSLSVEEQFYLLWPAAIAFLGMAGGLRVALAAILSAPLLRVAVFYGWPSQRALVDQAFPMIFDGLATGCVLAIARDRLWQDPRYRRLLESPLMVLVPLAVVGAYLYIPSVGVQLLVGQSVIHVGVALCLDWAIRFPRTLIGRGLNARPLVWLGTISYSLYLWQQLFLCRHHSSWITTFPQNLGLAFACAILSYQLIEQPLLRLRARYGI